MPELSSTESALSDERRNALAHLLGATPDAALAAIGDLSRSLPGAKAADLEEMVAAEHLSRRRRTRAMGVLAPLCRERTDGVEALTFPAAVLPRLWAEASSRDPDLLPLLDETGDRCEAVAERLCQRAAAIVRDQPDLVWPPDDASDRAERLEALAAVLDLSRLARRLAPTLKAWTARPDETEVLQLRATLREAGDIAPEGGVRLIDVVFAHMADAWLILRVVVQTSSVAGGEALLRGSDMGVFVERLITALEARLGRLGAFAPEPDADFEAFRADLAWCSATLTEISATLDLHPKSPWGARVRNARAAAGVRLSRRLRTVDKTLARAFPDRRIHVVGMVTRDTPRLDIDLTGREVRQAEAACAFLAALRGPAALLGCEAERLKAAESAVDRLFDRADQSVDAIHGGDLEAEPGPGDARSRAAHARAVIGRMADLLEGLEADQAARTVRRRIATSARSQPPI